MSGALLQESEAELSGLCQTDPVKLSKKLYQNLVLSDGPKYDFFKSLDHSRVDPQLQVRYLLRLVSERVSEDESVWEKFMTLLYSMGERQMYNYLSELTSNMDKEIWYDCLSEFSTGGHAPCLEAPLNINDIYWILEVLIKVSPKWKLIAIALKLPNYEIESCRQRDLKISLYNVLSIWLARDPSSPPGITMSTLLAALRSELVGEGRVAIDLDNKYKQNSSTFSLVNSNTLADQNYDVEVADGKSILLLGPRKSVCYQWKKDGQPLANSCTYYGVNEDILVVSHASQGTEGEYTCCVSCGGSEECSNKITLTVLYPPAKKLLLDLYSIHREVPPDSWPPVGTKSFINLTVAQSSTDTVVSREATDTRVKVDYGVFLEQHKSRTLVIVEGRPGSGKTTLVHKIVKDWSKGVLLRKAKFVFLVTLRIINHNTTQETLPSMLESLYYNEETELKNICEEIEKVNGDGMCFIIDGLDEYHPQNRDKSLIYRLINKAFLPLAMIIVTSRPVAVETLNKEIITYKVEVLGFSKEQILEYIDSFPFAGSSCDSRIATTYPTKLKEYLHSHPNVFNMCYLPVHAAMICFLFKYQKGSIPNTQTKIYQEFTRSTILRHLRRHNDKAQVYSLNKLNGSTKENFNKLCHLAYSMTVSGKQVATPEVMEGELCEYVSRDSDEWCLGLVTINHIAELSGITKTYSFLHLTVQEFLTAYYIISLKQDEQKQILLTLAYKSSPVVIFHFGLVRGQIDKIRKEVLYYIHDSKVLCHCAFESQQKVVCDEVGKNCNYDLFYPTPYDLNAASYVILNTTHPVTHIRLDSGAQVNCGYTDFLQSIREKDLSSLETLETKIMNNTTTLALSDLLRNCTSLKKVIFSFYKISQDSAEAIVDKFNSLKSLQDLCIIFHSTVGGITTLLHGLACFVNTALRLSFNDINASVVFEVASSLQLFTNHDLCGLVLIHCSVDDAAAAALANGLYSIVNACQLTIKHIANRSVGVIIPVLKNIHCLTKLQYLHFVNTHICCDGVTILANQLQYLPLLNTLDLSHNTIGPLGAENLANNLHFVNKLEQLKLLNNNIGPHGAVSLGKVLHHLTLLHQLKLSHNNIDLKSTKFVLTASKKCPHLQNICLNIYLEDCNAVGIQVEGLVSPDDSTDITDLMTAARHPIMPRQLRLGFKSVFLPPQSEYDGVSGNNRVC